MGAVRVNGSTSGYVELAAPAVAGSVVMTLPATTGTLAVQGEAYGRSATATVAPQQSTSSASFTDLATVGPAVTLTTGTKALVILSGGLSNDAASKTQLMGFAVSGATTVAAADATSILVGPAAAVTGPNIRVSAATLVTGLTAGSNVFTAKYRTSPSGNAYFDTRVITVIDMGS